MTAPISPINQKIISAPVSSSANNAPMQNPVPEKNDTVELSTKNKTGLIDKIKANKKVLIPVAIGLAAIAGGLAYAIKTGKISFKGKIEQKANEILSESEKIKQRASEIAEEGQKQYNEVLAILQKAKEEGFKDVVDKSGKTIRRFVDDTSTEGAGKIMDELDGDKILRKTYFNPNNLEISKIDKGITQNPDKTKSLAESFDYSHGKLFAFTKNYKWNADKTEGFIYLDGKLSIFIKDCKSNPDGTTSWAENFMYSDGKLSQFTKDFKLNPDRTASCAENFIYSDGKLSEFIKDCKSNPDGTEKWAKKFTRNEKGKLVKVDPQRV